MTEDQYDHDNETLFLDYKIDQIQREVKAELIASQQIPPVQFSRRLTLLNTGCYAEGENKDVKLIPYKQGGIPLEKIRHPYQSRRQSTGSNLNDMTHIETKHKIQGYEDYLRPSYKLSPIFSLNGVKQIQSIQPNTVTDEIFFNDFPIQDIIRNLNYIDSSSRDEQSMTIPFYEDHRQTAILLATPDMSSCTFDCSFHNEYYDHGLYEPYSEMQYASTSNNDKLLIEKNHSTNDNQRLYAPRQPRRRSTLTYGTHEDDVQIDPEPVYSMRRRSILATTPIGKTNAPRQPRRRSTLTYGTHEDDDQIDREPVYLMRSRSILETTNAPRQPRRRSTLTYGTHEDEDQIDPEPVRSMRRRSILETSHIGKTNALRQPRRLSTLSQISYDDDDQIDPDPMGSSRPVSFLETTHMSSYSLDDSLSDKDNDNNIYVPPADSVANTKSTSSTVDTIFYNNRSNRHIINPSISQKEELQRVANRRTNPPRQPRRRSTLTYQSYSDVDHIDHELLEI